MSKIFFSGLPHTSLVNGIPHGSMEVPGTRRYGNQPAGPPCTPTNFHVEKIIGNSSLKLSWQPVTLDNEGCSNGVKVMGYRVGQMFE